MKDFFKATTLTVLAAAFAVPTFVLAELADPKTTTCAEFSGLDVAAQTMAVQEMYKVSPEGANAAQQDEATWRLMVDKTAAACLANPDMLAMDAMMAK